MKSNPMRVAFSTAVFMSPFFTLETSHPEKFESPKSWRVKESGIFRRIMPWCSVAVLCSKQPVYYARQRVKVCGEMSSLLALKIMLMNALCLHHQRRIALPFLATAAPILKTRKGYHRNPPRALFGDEEEGEREEQDENKTPLSSLTSAIELRSKLQEVALVAQTRY